ncbi:MAG: ABC-2 family transporter protein [Pyrinomonadaceae bacterium]
MAFKSHPFHPGDCQICYLRRLIGYAGSRLGIKITDYLLSAVPILFGFISLYSLWFMLGATSIWFVKIYNVTEVLRGLLEAGRYPMVVYPTAYRFSSPL